MAVSARLGASGAVIWNPTITSVPAVMCADRRPPLVSLPRFLTIWRQKKLSAGVLRRPRSRGVVVFLFNAQNVCVCVF